MHICPSCGASLNEGDSFCQSCGTPRPEAGWRMTADASLPSVSAPSVPAAPSAKPVSMGAFIGLLLLFLIPVVGVIAAFIFAFFVKKNETVSNFARAVLVIMGVTAVLMLVCGWLFSLVLSFALKQTFVSLSQQMAVFEPTFSTLEELIRLILSA